MSKTITWHKVLENKNELTTSVKYGMDIKLILLSNNELSKISKEQRSNRFNVFATDLHNPNFSEFANSCGALGIRVTHIEELGNAMRNVLNHKGTALLEIVTDVNRI